MRGAFARVVTRRRYARAPKSNASFAAQCGVPHEAAPEQAHDEMRVPLGKAGRRKEEVSCDAPSRLV